MEIVGFLLKGGDTIKVSPPFLILLFLFSCLPIFLSAQINFKEVSHQYSIQHYFSDKTIGGGICVYDFDKDGLDDLTLATTQGQKIGFYKNTGEGFDQVYLLESNLETVKQMNWVDFDNDGDVDLYVAANDGISRLYENEGDLILTDITEKSGLPLTVHFGYGACWGDYNRDGWVDLYYASKGIIGNRDFIKSYNRLFRNNADGTFTEQTFEANAHDEDKLPFCAAFFDYNNDKWPDIYIANDKLTFNTLLANREGVFEDISISSRSNSRMNAMCVAPGDYNQDGWTDIYITNTPVGSHCLENSGILNASGYIRFENKAVENGTAFTGGNCWGANFFDADNDGDLDLYVNSSIPKPKEVSSAFFENLGKGFFEMPHIEGLQRDTSSSYTNAIGDFNGDGLLDIVVQNNPPDPFFLWENQSPPSNNWIKMQLEGVKSNRDGIGTKIELFADTLYQMHYTLCGSGFLGQNSSYKHFGIGEREVVDSIVLTWTTGHIDKIYNLPVNQVLYFKEGTSTSGKIQIDEEITIKERALSTAIEPVSNTEELLLFPNPAQHYLTIDFPSVTSFELLTLTGKILSSDLVSHLPYQKNIVSLPSGIYLAKIRKKDNTSYYQKWIKL